MTENLKTPRPFAGDALTEVIAQSAKEILAAAILGSQRSVQLHARFGQLAKPVS